MNVMESLLLGLSTGATCLISCGPILISFLLGERQNLSRSYRYMGQFLGGRLLAYGLLGGIVGGLGRVFSVDETSLVFGLVFCVLAVLMIVYGFHRFGQVCLGTVRQKVERRIKSRFPNIVPVLTGFLTALNLCPPLLLAISGAGTAGSIFSGMGVFVLFFVGTAVYFLPLPFMALLRRNQVLQVIGKYAAILVGLIYLYKGIVIIINSI